MDKERRIFQIPDLETEEQDVDNPINIRHFLPGKLIKDAKNLKDPKTSENKLSTVPEVSVKQPNIHQSEFGKFFEGDKAACNVRVISDGKETSKNKMDTVAKNNVSKSSTKFENAFSSLRTSKYYDEVSAEVNQSKSTDKISKSTSSILVNPRQRGNPLLKNIRNVPWEFEEIEPDYVMGKSTCALYLSMRYHNLFPNYIHERLKALGKSYQLRVLLVQVDVVDPNPPLKDLSIIAILADCTLMVAWNSEEAGSYLETYKMYENKSADLIMEKQGADTYSQLVDCLTTVRSVNKTDAMVLLSTFKTLEKIIQASVSDLALCPGIGPLKAKRLYDALRKPVKQERKDL